MTTKKRIIISASRRTDLPKFYYEWLQKALRQGIVELRNPIFKEKAYHVDVRPENVHSLVLWSKDFQNVLNSPMYLENYNLYFQYTINSYASFLEPHVPGYQDSIKILAGLLKKYRPEQFNIRFDPIIISTRGEIVPTSHQPGLARLTAFTKLCQDLSLLGMENSRLTTSYLTLYNHVKKRLQNTGLELIHLDETKQRLFLERMVEIADRYNLQIFSCASSILEGVPGVKKGHCIDGHLLESLFEGSVSKAKDTGQRASCGCTKSSDIGSYNQGCYHDCIYCYQRTKFTSSQ